MADRDRDHRSRLTEADAERLAGVDTRRVLAVSVAEGGAMGCPGQIILAVAGEAETEFLCFYDKNLLEQIFPWFAAVEDWAPGRVRNLAEGWRYVDLGMGNHLFLPEAVYKKVRANFAGERPSHIYQKWMPTVERRMSKSR
ncbi:MAG: hypothetical protein IK116_06180 [Firmicutes bacterium]|nr:hypothetical protein [Bacillota bacterium]